MATRITKRDIARVYDHVERVIGPCKRGAHGFLYVDNKIQILVSGWSIGGGWSRGFMLDYPEEGIHFSRHADTGGRYQGQGWHARMALDIVAKLIKLREAS